MDEFDRAAQEWRTGRRAPRHGATRRPWIERAVWLACLAIGVAMAWSVAAKWPTDLSAGEVAVLLVLDAMGGWIFCDLCGLGPSEMKEDWQVDRWRSVAHAGLILLIFGLGFALMLPIWTQGRPHQLLLVGAVAGETFRQRYARRWF